jgi:hypothetical protein
MLVFDMAVLITGVNEAVPELRGVTIGGTSVSRFILR